MRSIPKNGRLRVLAVETRPELSSEASVLRSLLSAVDRGSAAGSIDTLLIQGVDPERATGNQAANALAELEGVRVYRLEVGALGRPDLGSLSRAMKVLDVFRLYRQWDQVVEAVQDFEPHVVYSAQQRWDQQVATRLARRFGCPRAVHLHYTVGPWLGKKAVAALSTADTVIAVSDFIRENAVSAGLDPARVETLYNPIGLIPEPTREGRNAARDRLRDELCLPWQALLVGMVARLSPSKCQTSLVEAMIHPLRRNDRAHLVFAGEEYPSGNGMTDLLQRTAARAGVGAQVHLLGQRNDVPALLDAFDIFAHPTLSEPCALAVLEAMAHGLPVVAWADGGTVDLVENSKTGILLPPGDIGALTNAIDSLLADRHRREELGARGRVRARSVFDPDDASVRFVAMLQEVAGSAEAVTV